MVEEAGRFGDRCHVRSYQKIEYHEAREVGTSGG